MVRHVKDKATTKKSKHVVIMAIADTTWRMFTPSMIGIFGGLKLDQALGTLPWFFVIGTLLGCVVAGLLVTRQLKD